MDGSEQLVRAKVVGICTRPWEEGDGLGRLTCAPSCASLHPTPTLSVLVAGWAPISYATCRRHALLHVYAPRCNHSGHRPASGKQMHECNPSQCPRKRLASRNTNHTSLANCLSGPVACGAAKPQDGKVTLRPSVRSCCPSHVTDTPHMSDWPTRLPSHHAHQSHDLVCSQAAAARSSVAIQAHRQDPRQCRSANDVA
jgi:hypothetical protein